VPAGMKTGVLHSENRTVFEGVREPIPR